MPQIRYEAAFDSDPDKLVALYASVGWTNYTNSPAVLAAAVQNSASVICAWDGDDLVGLARVVGDGHCIAYLQDILVHPDYQRHGIGRELFKLVFEPFASVRQKVLITDDEPAQRAFYESMGFAEASELKPPIRTFVKFD